MYIDVDDKYHFIVGEMLKQHCILFFASSVNASLQIFSDNYGSIETIILCIDNIDHFDIINRIWDINHDLHHLILVSRDIDAMKMYEFIAMYGADDYLIKPFSRQGILDAYSAILKNGIRPYKKRLFNDIRFFNNTIE